MKLLSILLVKLIVAFSLHSQTQCYFDETPNGFSSSNNSSLSNLDYFKNRNWDPLKIRCNLIFLNRDDGTGNYSPGDPLIKEFADGMNHKIKEIRDGNCSNDPNYPYDANVRFVTEVHFINNTEAWDYYNVGRDLIESNDYGKYAFCPNKLQENWPALYEEVDHFYKSHKNEINIFFVENGDHMDFLENAIENEANGIELTEPWQAPVFVDIFSGCSKFADQYDDEENQFIIMAGQYSEYLKRFHFRDVYTTPEGLSSADEFRWDFPRTLNHEVGHTIMDQWHVCDCPKDLMSGGGLCNYAIRNYLPYDRLSKLHNVLASTNLHKFVLCESITGNNGVAETIGDVTIFRPMNFYNDVIVNDGHTVTLKSDTYLSEFAEIIVKPGGRLIIDGGVLTSLTADCGMDRWKGITVISDTDGIIEPGLVELKNGAIIENARIAIRTHNDMVRGGQVVVDDAIIRNCWKGIEFAGFEYDTPPIVNNLLVEDCFYGITINEVEGVVFTDIKMKNIESRGMIVSNCELNLIGTSQNSSYFDNCNKAIRHVFSHDPVSPSSIEGVNFRNNTDKAIHVNGNDPMTFSNNIYRNIFDDNTIGIDLQFANSYNINGNIFIENGVSSFESNSNSLINFYEFNTHLSNGWGLVGMTNNDQLKFKYNCFENSTFGDVVGNGNFSKAQGGPTFAASNCFSGNGAFDFLYFGNNNLVYYTPDEDTDAPACMIPADYSNIQFVAKYIETECQTGFVNPNNNGGSPNSTNNTPIECVTNMTGTSFNDFLSQYNSIRTRRANMSSDDNTNTQTNELEISQLSFCERVLVRYIINEYLTDNNIDAAVRFYKNASWFDQRKKGYSLLLNKKRYTEAKTYLNQMTAVTKEEREYIAIARINIDYHRNLDTYNATGSDLNRIRSFANEDHAYAAHAIGLYYLLTGEWIDRTYPDLPIRQRSSDYKKNSKEKEYSIFPNPTQDELNIHISNNIDNNLIIELWDMLGNKVLEKEFNDDQVSFSTKNMTKGVYLVKIKQENQELYTQKILLID